MPINSGYNENAVTQAIATALETFYSNLIAKIDELKTYAEKNMLEAKTSALEILKEEVGWNVTKSGYKNTNVWGI